MKKIGAGIVLIILFALGAHSAQAISLDDLSSTVKSLQQEVGALRSQLGLALSALESATGSSTSTRSSNLNTTSAATNVSTAPVSVESTSRTSTSSASLRSAGPGDTGAHVTAIQNILRARGLLTAPATGYYGPQTERAVRTFQTANRITGIGRVGPQTIGALTTAPIEVVDATATTLDLTSGTIWVSRNMAYPDQTVSPHAVHHKIGSYIVHNDTAESVKLSSLLIGFTTGGAGSVTNLSNLSATVNSVSSGSTLTMVSTYQTITASTIIASGATATVDLYSDTGSATSGSVRSNLLVGGIGLSTSTLYNSGSSYSGQAVYFGATPLCTINSFTATPNVVSAGLSSMLAWSTSNCTSASITGGSVSSTALSGSASTGALYATTTYTITAYGTTGSPVTRSVTVVVSSTGTLIVARNTTYPNQTIAPGTTHFKVGVFTVMNTSSESIAMTGLRVGLTSTGFPLSNVGNFQALTSGVMIGTTIATPSAIVTISTSTVIPAGAMIPIELYADFGAAPSGTLQSSLTVSGVGLTSGLAYGMSTLVSGQVITVASTGNLLIAKNTTYPNQTIAPNTLNFKLAAFSATNTASESIVLTNLGINVISLPSTGGVTNYKVYMDGIQVGPTMTSLSGISVSRVVPPGGAVAIEFYGDVGPAPSGTIQLGLGLIGVGASSGLIYPLPLGGGTIATAGQVITVSSTACSLTTPPVTAIQAIPDLTTPAGHVVPVGSTNVDLLHFTLKNVSPCDVALDTFGIGIAGPPGAYWSGPVGATFKYYTGSGTLIGSTASAGNIWPRYVMPAGTTQQFIVKSDIPSTTLPGIVLPGSVFRFDLAHLKAFGTMLGGTYLIENSMGNVSGWPVTGNYMTII